MSLPLLLGEAPGPGGGTGDPLGKRTARRLCDFAGWAPEFDGEDPYRAALAKRFELRNLLDFPPERQKGGKGTVWPLPEARRAAEGLELRGTVVFLGKRVAGAYDAPTEYFEWSTFGDARVVCVPHPSPVNRVLNDPAARAATGRILREAAGE